MQKIKFTKEEYFDLIDTHMKKDNLMCKIMDLDGFNMYNGYTEVKNILDKCDKSLKEIIETTRLLMILNVDPNDVDNPLICKHYDLMNYHLQLIDQYIDTYERYILNS